MGVYRDPGSARALSEPPQTQARSRNRARPFRRMEAEKARRFRDWSPRAPSAAPACSRYCAKVGQIWPTGRAANVVRRGGLGAIGLPRPPRRTGGRSNAFRRRAAASRNCGVRTARPSKAKSLLIPLPIYRDRFSGALPLTAHQEFSGDGSDAPQRSLRPPRCLEKKPDFASTPLVGSRVRAIHQDAGA